MQCTIKLCSNYKDPHKELPQLQCCVHLVTQRTYRLMHEPISVWQLRTLSPALWPTEFGTTSTIKTPQSGSLLDLILQDAGVKALYYYILKHFRHLVLCIIRTYILYNCSLMQQCFECSAGIINSIKVPDLVEYSLYSII